MTNLVSLLTILFAAIINHMISKACIQMAFMPRFIPDICFDVSNILLSPPRTFCMKIKMFVLLVARRNALLIIRYIYD